MTIRVPSELIERDPSAVAPAAGLVYVPDTEPGITRRQRGRGFSYSDPDGCLVADDVRTRIEGLAIPPAWRSVWISPAPDGYLQASGLDEAERKQYRYHDEFRQYCEARKFARLRDFARAVVVLRKAAAAGLTRNPGHRDHAVAAAITLIDSCLLRVGNDQSASTGHYGATTLTVDHVVDNGYITLEYTAKSGQARTIVVEDDDLSDVLTNLADGADDELFWFDDDDGLGRRRATAADINRFIAEHVGPAFSAKDFRTWGGSAVALAALASGKRALEAVDTAADQLGNTRAVARSSYIHPLVLDSDPAVLEDVWARSQSSRWRSRSEGALTKLLGSH